MFEFIQKNKNLKDLPYFLEEIIHILQNFYKDTRYFGIYVIGI